MVESIYGNVCQSNRFWSQDDLKLCSPIPPNTPHAVSVSLPKWEDNVDYEEGAQRVVSIMKSGYPRFCIHESVIKLNEQLSKRLGINGLLSYSFPSRRVAQECKIFINKYSNDLQKSLIQSITLAEYKIGQHQYENLPSVTLYIVSFPYELKDLAKAFWQHTGEIISSRFADYCLRSLNKSFSSPIPSSLRRNKRYSKESIGTEDNRQEHVVDGNIFIEERFGRNLSINLAHLAKLTLRKRIASGHQLSNDLVEKSEITLIEDHDIENVYLYPTGMSAIYNAHRLALASFGQYKSVCFGFPYTDTLKILQKFGPGCEFLGKGDQEDLNLLESIASKEKLLALFCEFPGNPLLKSPDLINIRKLANKYGFLVIVDDTLGNFINTRVAEFADITVSSLTKIFSGDSNVMGGSLTLSKKSQHYNQLKNKIDEIYEDLVWCEDAVFLERNSRVFEDRIKLINQYTENLCDYLIQHPLISKIHYPKYSTPEIYNQLKSSIGGYGGLFSIEFKNPNHSIDFYDNLPTAKGPSLGTNFTLACPYTLLAHYNELPWAQSFGVSPNIVRVSVGLEGEQWLKEAFSYALENIKL